MNRSVFCGNLHALATEELIHELFLQAGPVDTVTLHPARGREPGYAFATFHHPVSVGYALSLLAGSRLFGRELELRSPITNARPFGAYRRRRRLPRSAEFRVVFVYSGSEMRRIRDEAGLSPLDERTQIPSPAHSQMTQDTAHTGAEDTHTPAAVAIPAGMQFSAGMQSPEALQPAEDTHTPAAVVIPAGRQSPEALQPAVDTQTPAAVVIPAGMQFSAGRQSPEALQLAEDTHTPAAVVIPAGRQSPDALQPAVDKQTAVDTQTREAKELSPSERLLAALTSTLVLREDQARQDDEDRVTSAQDDDRASGRPRRRRAERAVYVIPALRAGRVDRL